MPLTLAASWSPAPEGGGLRPEDVLSSEEYARCRDIYRARMIALKRARRVAIGPNASIVFECRATVLFQIQEVMWIEGRAGHDALVREIDTYACLVPPPRGLRASLMIHGGPATLSEVVLAAGDHVAAGREIAPGDASDPVRYLAFSLDGGFASRLGRGDAAHLRVRWADVEAITPLPPALARTLGREATGAPGPDLDPATLHSSRRGDPRSPSTSRPTPLVSENHHVRSGGPQGP